MTKRLSELAADAREALDSMDDFARMEAGVDPHGPRCVLERFIADAEDLARRVEGACSAYIFSNAAPEPHQVSGVTAEDDAVIDSLDGQRVALVPVESGA